VSTEETTGVEISDPSRTRPSSKVFLAAGAGLAAIAAMGVLLVGGGGDELESALPPESQAASAEVDDVDVEGDSSPDVVDAAQTLPITTTEIFLSRDPFNPVVPEPVETVDAVEIVDENGDVVDPSDPDYVTSPILPGDPDAPGCVGQEEMICNGQVITLMDIARNIDDEPVAVIQVDTTIYEVVPGQTFAGDYQALLIDGACVTMLYGDEGFRLCKGDVVLK
jgi:hypothetical protein